MPLSRKMVVLRFLAARAAGVEHMTAHSGRVGLASGLTSCGASTTGTGGRGGMVAHLLSRGHRRAGGRGTIPLRRDETCRHEPLRVFAVAGTEHPPLFDTVERRELDLHSFILDGARPSQKWRSHTGMNAEKVRDHWVAELTPPPLAGADGAASEPLLQALMRELGTAAIPILRPDPEHTWIWSDLHLIQGGRARARRLLYMPALAAICYNPDLRVKYRQLVAQGKPRKVAVIAVMRKLLVLANALLGQDRCWLPERPGRDSAAAPAMNMRFVEA